MEDKKTQNSIPEGNNEAEKIGRVDFETLKNLLPATALLDNNSSDKEKTGVCDESYK